ncbi:MAG: hypothetical protein ACRENO_09370 [Thermodesulfobacteriota bacterium]
MKKLITVFSITLLFGSFFYLDSNAHEEDCKCECPEKKMEEMTDQKEMTEQKEMTDQQQVVVEEEIVQQEEQEIVGVVTAMDENAINIKDDLDGTLHKLWSEDPTLISNVAPGYRVEAVVSGERLLKLKTIGTPVNVEPTIIKIKRMVVDPAKTQ